MSPPSGPLLDTIDLADADTWHDLGTFFARARRVDPDGAGRLVVLGGVLASYVSPVHGAPGPTVIGLRTCALPDDTAALDVTVPLAALCDRLAVEAADRSLVLPPVRVTDAGWAGVSPPRSGWQLVTGLDPAELARAAAAGVAEVALAVPEAAGAQVIAKVRAAVWGRDLDGSAAVPGLPAGAAFAAESLGFLDIDEAVAVRRAGPWWRLSTARGHVLARRALI